MYFMKFGDSSKFIGRYISCDKCGPDITINANPIVTIYPINRRRFEVDVYL